MQDPPIADAERMRSLLRAILALESELTVDAVHRAIVTQACGLVGAREATLAVVSKDGRDVAPLVHAGHRVAASGSAGHAPDCSDGATHTAADNYALRVPVRIRDEVYAYLYLAGKQDGTPLSAEDVTVAEAFATSAGGAVENARLHSQVVDLGVSAERVRIAHDLHDTVLQRLFAIGLSLESSLRESAPGVSVERVHTAIDDLDETIQQVRAAIFALEPAVRGRQRLGARLLDVVRWSGELLGVEPTVRFAGPVDRALEEAVVASLLVALRETLADLARRGATSSVAVEVELLGEPSARELVLKVAAPELGGTPARARERAGRDRRSGARSANPPDDDWLTGVTGRAEILGGTCNVHATPGGAELVWRVPLSPR